VVRYGGALMTDLYLKITVRLTHPTNSTNSEKAIAHIPKKAIAHIPKKAIAQILYRY
jgi:hypothetical protein